MAGNVPQNYKNGRSHLQRGCVILLGWAQRSARLDGVYWCPKRLSQAVSVQGYGQAQIWNRVSQKTPDRDIAEARELKVEADNLREFVHELT